MPYSASWLRPPSWPEHTENAPRCESALFATRDAMHSAFLWPSLGWFKRGIEQIRAKWAQLVQLASAADDVVCEARDLNLTFGIFGPTARTQTGNVHRLGEEQ